MGCCLPSRVLYLGDYVLQGAVGSGTFAHVKLARHTSSGQIVALKIIHRPDGINHFKNESTILQELHHNHVVKFKFAKSHETYKPRQFYTPYVDVIGLEPAITSIDQCLVKGNAFSPETALGLFSQLLDALAYCHDRGISHRDIKPHNLLISCRFTLLLADFGTATKTARSNTYCGSYMYMAPEIHNRVSMYSARKADVWSSGLCFFNFISADHAYSFVGNYDHRYRLISQRQWDSYWALHNKRKGNNRELPRYIQEAVARVLIVDPVLRLGAKELLRGFIGQEISKELVVKELAQRIFQCTHVK